MHNTEMHPMSIQSTFPKILLHTSFLHEKVNNFLKRSFHISNPKPRI